MDEHESNLLHLMEQDLHSKKEEINKKMRQWEKLNTKIDQVLEKIKQRKNGK